MNDHYYCCCSGSSWSAIVLGELRAAGSLGASACHPALFAAIISYIFLDTRLVCPPAFCFRFRFNFFFCAHFFCFFVFFYIYIHQCLPSAAFFPRFFGFLSYNDDNGDVICRSLAGRRGISMRSIRCKLVLIEPVVPFIVLSNRFCCLCSFFLPTVIFHLCFLLFYLLFFSFSSVFFSCFFFFVRFLLM